MFSLRDLSEQIKAATKENHVRAENTKLMLSYQKGQITLPQYKVRLVTCQLIDNADGQKNTSSV